MQGKTSPIDFKLLMRFKSQTAIRLDLSGLFNKFQPATTCSCRLVGNLVFRYTHIILLIIKYQISLLSHRGCWKLASSYIYAIHHRTIYQIFIVFLGLWKNSGSNVEFWISYSYRNVHNFILFNKNWIHKIK